MWSIRDETGTGSVGVDRITDELFWRRERKMNGTRGGRESWYRRRNVVNWTWKWPFITSSVNIKAKGWQMNTLWLDWLHCHCCTAVERNFLRIQSAVKLWHICKLWHFRKESSTLSWRFIDGKVQSVTHSLLINVLSLYLLILLSWVGLLWNYC